MEDEPRDELATRATFLIDEALVILDRLGMSVAAAHLQLVRELLAEKRS